jgi:CO/xanthine dehydrogenase Mo-binding subunit
MSDERAARIADKYIPRLVEDAEAGIARALAFNRGNVSEAANELGLDSAELRRMIQKSERLQGVMVEVMERSVDKAIGIIQDGMDEESYLVKFYAAKEFLRTEAGRRRGFGQPQHAQVVEGRGGGATVIVLKWLGDEDVEPKTIEGTTLGPLE